MKECIFNFIKRHLICTFVTAVMMALVAGATFGYYGVNYLKVDGVYVIMGSRQIAVEGNVQVDQLEAMVQTLSQFDAKIPRGHWIWANQTYVPYIPETKILSGAYHYGIDEGDAYSVAMWLMSSKDGFPRYVERNHGARETIYTDRTTNDLRISTAGLAATHLVSKMLFGEQ
jgi:hypothetical protein